MRLCFFRLGLIDHRQKAGVDVVPGDIDGAIELDECPSGHIDGLDQPGQSREPAEFGGVFVNDDELVGQFLFQLLDFCKGNHISLPQFQENGDEGKKGLPLPVAIVGKSLVEIKFREIGVKEGEFWGILRCVEPDP